MKELLTELKIVSEDIKREWNRILWLRRPQLFSLYRNAWAEKHTLIHDKEALSFLPSGCFRFALDLKFVSLLREYTSPLAVCDGRVGP